MEGRLTPLKTTAVAAVAADSFLRGRIPIRDGLFFIFYAGSALLFHATGGFVGSR